jgi:hypothetical protein
MFRIGWKPRAGIVLAILAVAIGTTRLEQSRMAASAAGTGARVEGASRVNPERLLKDVETLSSPEFEGRLTGSAGNHKAQAFILRRFRELGLQPMIPLPDGPGYQQTFAFTHHSIKGLVMPGRPFRQEFSDATNLMGFVAGSAEPGRFTTVTAHYDHLGVGDGHIYPGADDNASGVAAVLAAAEYFSRHRPRRSILFIAFDGEEEGLQGSTYFIAHPPVALRAIVLEVNLDMVARGDRNELVVAGTYASPQLKAPLVEAARGRHLTLIFGHDRPWYRAGAVEDWTHSSDQGPFHDAGIPFLYFGVEDHPDYHRPTDTADKIPRPFFVEAANLVIDALLTFDQR